MRQLIVMVARWPGGEVDTCYGGRVMKQLPVMAAIEGADTPVIVNRYWKKLHFVVACSEVASCHGGQVVKQLPVMVAR